MGTARFKRSPGKAPGLSAGAAARLDALTPEEIQHNAETDPDNPPMTAEELEAVRIARSVQEIRKARGLSQAEFATAYRIAPGTLKDWEQGRRRPDTAALAYLETIRHEPAAVARALKKAAQPQRSAKLAS